MSILCTACHHDFKQEKIIDNQSDDTLWVYNPDIDTSYTIYPGQSAMVYSFEVLDTKQESEDCKWLGDTLIIKTINNLSCTKIVAWESNWSSSISGPDKDRLQICTFTVRDEDFE